jgi:hypothetical protein
LVREIFGPCGLKLLISGTAQRPSLPGMHRTDSKFLLSYAQVPLLDLRRLPQGDSLTSRAESVTRKVSEGASYSRISIQQRFGVDRAALRLGCPQISVTAIASELLRPPILFASMCGVPARSPMMTQEERSSYLLVFPNRLACFLLRLFSNNSDVLELAIIHLHQLSPLPVPLAAILEVLPDFA